MYILSLSLFPWTHRLSDKKLNNPAIVCPYYIRIVENAETYVLLNFNEDYASPWEFWVCGISVAGVRVH